jgi:chromate transporter
LFLVFVKVGLISFGGGYAAITMIQQEVEEAGWLNASKFQELVSLAGMAPGSIATNTATLVGYTMGGGWGALTATAGIIMPSLVIVILLAAFFLKLHSKEWVKSSFYGLRPIVTGLILYAALHLGLGGPSGPWLRWMTVGTLLIIFGCLVLVAKYKAHPFMVIAVSAVAGIVFF